MSIDAGQLIEDIKNAASDVLEEDIATVAGFSERQVEAIAHQTELVGAGILTGQITEETRDFFLDNLKDMAMNLVRVLQGLVTVMIEKAWNAIVGVIWKAIEAATGVALPTP